MQGSIQDDAWPEAVRRFWFIELDESDWFRPADQDALDATIKARFEGQYEALRARASTLDPPDGPVALAMILVLDQFPRNMFRDTPAMFATDDDALRLAQISVARGYDTALTPEERQFLFMPYMHSEDAGVQAAAIDLFRSIGKADVDMFALRHKEIIDRFGRFPHRNAILGRETTDEEAAFLKEPNSSF
ncbi:MAG: DUF924 family protein [Pseudomonadota bacterium]